jgi:O-antigen ligase
VHLPPLVAAIIYAAGIAGLYWLDRDPANQSSKALWIPAAWLFLISSRSLSMWLQISPSGNKADIYLEGSPIDRALILTLLVAGLIALVGRAEQLGTMLKRNLPVLLFFSYGAISILWSDYPLITFKHWIKGIGDVVMVLVIVTEPKPMHALKWLITRLGYLLFPLSLLFIKYYPNLGRRLTNSWMQEPVGVATQKNQLGMICLVYGLGFLWCLRAANRDRQDPNRSRRMLAFAIILVLVAYLLWASNSRSGLFSFVIAVAVMLLASRPSMAPKPAVVHLLVLTVLSLSVYSLFFDATRSVVLSLEGTDETFYGRSIIWHLVLSMDTNPWVGTGYESFWLGERLERIENAFPGMEINESHNGYLEVYANMGWIGVGLLALLLVTGYRKIIAKFRLDPNTGSLLIAYALATVCCNFSESGFRMMTVTWFFLLVPVFGASVTPLRDDSGLTGPSWPEHSAEAELEVGVWPRVGSAAHVQQSLPGSVGG